MSAFFVARATIDAAVAAFIAKDGPLSLEAATELGRALWALNAEAVRWRYDLDAGTPEERAEHAANLAEAAGYAWTPRELALAVVAKSLRCLRYQCSEGPVVDAALYGRMDELCQGYEATGVTDTAAYHRAPWGLKDSVPSDEPETHTELTPEGEQFVIPGCERNRSNALRQLDLFG